MMAEAAQYISYPAGQKIIEKGTVGNIFYVIKSGDVVCKDLKDNKSEVCLGAGDFVGERALLTDELRSGNVYAVEEVQVVAIDRDTFQELMGSLETVLDRNLSMRALKSMGLLVTLSEDELTQLSGALHERSYAEGDYIIKQFDKGNEFFIIKSGSVAVTVNVTSTSSAASSRDGGEAQDQQEKQEKQVDTMEANDYFGEMSLIEDEQRSANIVAATESVVCLVLDKSNFARLLGPSRVAMTREAVGRKVNKALHITDVTMADVDVMTVLGTGNFSVVKLVKHKQTKDTMAVKIMSKVALVAKGQAGNIIGERDMLLLVHHPFVMRLIATSQDAMQLYMFTELCMGGELFSYLHESRTRRTHAIPMAEAIFFAGCVTEALEHMHSKGIVYRDLKPENVMLDQDGYCKLVDFGFARRLDTRLFTICGTMEYLAPEVLLRKGYGKGCDYWGLGILIFEMVVGKTPWAGGTQKTWGRQDELQQAEAICNGFSAYNIPPFIRVASCKDIMKGLLAQDPAKRLGCMKDGAGGIKSHAWFATLDWGNLRSKQIPAPWVPPMQSTNDVSNFPDQEEMSLASFSQFDLSVPLKPIGFKQVITFEPTPGDEAASASGAGLRVAHVKDPELASKLPIGALLLGCNTTSLIAATSDDQAQREIRTASGGRTSTTLRFEVAGGAVGAASSVWTESFAAW
jgi:cGMP-dependent protein kinase